MKWMDKFVLFVCSFSISIRCLIISSHSLTGTLVHKLSASKLIKRSSGSKCKLVTISIKWFESLITVLLLPPKGTIMGSMDLARPIAEWSSWTQDRFSLSNIIPTCHLNSSVSFGPPLFAIRSVDAIISIIGMYFGVIEKLWHFSKN